MLKKSWAWTSLRPRNQQRMPLMENIRQHTPRIIHRIWQSSRLGSRAGLQLHTRTIMGFGMVAIWGARGQTGLLWRAQLRPGLQPLYRQALQAETWLPRQQGMLVLPLGSGHLQSWLPRPRPGLTGQPGRPRAAPSLPRSAATHIHQRPWCTQALQWASLQLQMWPAVHQRSLLQQSSKRRQRPGLTGQVGSMLPRPKFTAMLRLQQDLSREQHRLVKVPRQARQKW